MEVYWGEEEGAKVSRKEVAATSPPDVVSCCLPPIQEWGDQRQEGGHVQPQVRGDRRPPLLGHATAVILKPTWLAMPPQPLLPGPARGRHLGSREIQDGCTQLSQNVVSSKMEPKSCGCCHFGSHESLQASRSCPGRGGVIGVSPPCP